MRQTRTEGLPVSVRRRGRKVEGPLVFLTWKLWPQTDLLLASWMNLILFGGRCTNICFERFEVRSWGMSEF